MESNGKNFRFIVREYDWSSLNRNFAWVCLGTVFDGRRRTLYRVQSTFVEKNLMFFIEFTSIFEFHCLPCPLPLFTFPVSLHKLQKCKRSFCFLNSLIYVKDKTDENELDKAYDNIIENKF